MSRWQNFSIWRTKWPHWRADGVTYYATLRSKRELTHVERNVLFREFLKREGKHWTLFILFVGPEETQMIFQVTSITKGRPTEFTKLMEKIKSQFGKTLNDEREKRYGVFFNEIYDRIVRDDNEMEELWEAIFNHATEEGFEEDFLWVTSEVPRIQGEE